VPALVLARAKIRPVEDLLQAQHLHALLPRLGDQRDVLVEHRLLDLLNRLRFVVDRIGALDQSADELAGHFRVSWCETSSAGAEPRGAKQSGREYTARARKRTATWSAISLSWHRARGVPPRAAHALRAPARPSARPDAANH